MRCRKQLGQRGPRRQPRWPSLPVSPAFSILLRQVKSGEGKIKNSWPAGASHPGQCMLSSLTLHSRSTLHVERIQRRSRLQRDSRPWKKGTETSVLLFLLVTGNLGLFCSDLGRAWCVRVCLSLFGGKSLEWGAREGKPHREMKVVGRLGPGRTRVFRNRGAEDWGGGKLICGEAAQPCPEGGWKVQVSISCLFPSAYKCVFRLIVSAYN